MSESSRPNIVLILTDQQRLSTLKTYGDTPCRTPNLDALAARSVVFENAYTTCPLCSPARASIMTGLYPSQHGVTSNCGNTACAVPNLQDHPDLLPRRLSSEGYECLYTGKWHLGMPNEKVFQDTIPPTLPRDVGFKGQNFPGHGGGGFRYPEYAEYLNGLGTNHRVRNERALGEGFVPHFGILEVPVEATVPYFLAEHSIARMTEAAASDRPFFLWHNFWGPHEPYFVPQEYYDVYRDVDIPEWPNYWWPSEEIEGPHRIAINPSHSTLTWADWADAIRHYYAFMTLIDEQIGRIVKHLDDSGLMENTLLLFTADHGETLGSHGGLMDKGIMHFEEIQRIPFFVKLPGDQQAGSRREEFVSLVDLYPTFLDAAGSGADVSGQEVAGRSLLDLVRGVNEWRDDIVVQSEGVQSVNISLRTLRWKHYKYGFTVGMAEQLYDLERDPHELVNLAGSPAHAFELEEMRGRLARWMNAHDDHLLKKNAFRSYLLRQGSRAADD